MANILYFFCPDRSGFTTSLHCIKPREDLSIWEIFSAIFFNHPIQFERYHSVRYRCALDCWLFSQRFALKKSCCFMGTYWEKNILSALFCLRQIDIKPNSAILEHCFSSLVCFQCVAIAQRRSSTFRTSITSLMDVSGTPGVTNFSLTLKSKCDWLTSCTCFDCKFQTCALAPSCWPRLAYQERISRFQFLS